MRICQVSSYFPYKENIEGKSIKSNYVCGGVERHVYYLTKELSKLGHDVTVISTKSAEHEHLSEIDIGANIRRIQTNMRIYTASVPFSLF